MESTKRVSKRAMSEIIENPETTENGLPTRFVGVELFTLSLTRALATFPYVVC